MNLDGCKITIIDSDNQEHDITDSVGWIDIPFTSSSIAASAFVVFKHEEEIVFTMKLNALDALPFYPVDYGRRN